MHLGTLGNLVDNFPVGTRRNSHDIYAVSILLCKHLTTVAVVSDRKHHLVIRAFSPNFVPGTIEPLHAAS